MISKTRQEPEAVVREIRRKTRRKFSAEDKIRIILEGLKGEESIASIARRECSSTTSRHSKPFGNAEKGISG